MSKIDGINFAFLTSRFQVRCVGQRNRPTVKFRFAKCFVFRPAVRFRHKRNELGFNCERIKWITIPGSRPN